MSEPKELYLDGATEEELMHYGILRKSGRYPWGSGKNPYQRSQNFFTMVKQLRDQGMSDAEIAVALKLDTVTRLRQTTSIANHEKRAAEAARAQYLVEDRGMSITETARVMGKNESSIRSLLDPSIAKRQSVLNNVTNMLRAEVDEKKAIDIGKGIDNQLGISRDKLLTAVAILEDEGYVKRWVQAEQLGTGFTTNTRILLSPDTSYAEIMKDTSQIKLPGSYTQDGGKTFEKIQPPRSVDSSRIQVVYGEEGGKRDGLIELRRGVDDLDMGQSSYAQARILVDGTHYLKGMVVVSDDLPKGVDIRFHTPKQDTGNKLDAFKTVEPDPNNPFGSTIRKQKTFINKDGEKELTALNLVYDEGDWWKWKHTLSSQMLSKQPTSLAKQQLDIAYKNNVAEYEDIKSLTNPTLKQELLRDFSEKMDAAAVDLAAAGLPRTRNYVLLPDPGMKDNEIYAPTFKNGETVVLIRHPHGGTFEIPELVVNNKAPSARKLVGPHPTDAVVINHKVAQQLSGADFDGDSVLVIPNPHGAVKTQKYLKALENFEPKERYPGYEGMKVMKNTQTEMGMISNLITDMSIQGAPTDEIARAVKHSMVVIDAEKHKLNYKQSEIDHGIAELKKKYQVGGASTLISRASADIRIPKQKPRPVSEGGPIDKKTGELKFVPTGEQFDVPKVNKRTGEVTTQTIIPTQNSSRMREAQDARSLMSSKTGQPIERVYADHANALKSLANQARLEMINTPPLVRSKGAAQTYKEEVASLKAKLNVAQMNAPIERQAQLVAAAKVKIREASNPNMTSEQLKKVRSQELNDARAVLGAGKEKINITPREWEAIQAGAIAHTPLKEILNNADPKQVRDYATPKQDKGLPGAKLSRARSMANAGYTQAEIAEALGVSVSAIQEALK